MSTMLQRLRFHAFKKQNALCYYCEQRMWNGQPPSTRRCAKFLRCTAEHLIARQDGGLDSSENVVAACYWCNSRRHSGNPRKARSASEYKNRVAKLMARGTWHPGVV